MFVFSLLFYFNTNPSFYLITARRIIRREIRGARSTRCNSEILSSLIIPPNNAMNSDSNMSLGTASKGYALVLPSSTLTAPIGSKNNAGFGSSSSADRPRSALLPPVAPPPSASPVPSRPATFARHQLQPTQPVLPVHGRRNARQCKGSSDEHARTGIRLLHSTVVFILRKSYTLKKMGFRNIHQNIFVQFLF